MQRLLRRVVVVALAVATALGVVAATPALAATGGGCTQNPTTVTPCVSEVYPSVYSDFYLNAAPDSSRKTYRMEVWTGRNGQPWVLRNHWQGSLTHTGHYPQQKIGISALPSVSEHAFTRVYIYTSTGAVHYKADSPYVYYIT